MSCWRRKAKTGSLPTGRTRTIVKVWLVAWIFAALAGCGLFTPREERPLKVATVEELTDLLAERHEAMHSLKALFSAKITGGIMPIGQRVQGTLFYQRPDAIRLRGFTPLGGELFEFVQADGVYRLRLPTMGREVNGRRSEPQLAGRLSRAFQLSVWAMSGIVGTEPIGSSERVRLQEDGDRYRLEVFAAAGDPAAAHPSTLVRRIWFDRHMMVVVEEERVSPTGETEATMQFEDFRPVGQPAMDSVANPLASELGPGRLLRPFKILMKDRQGGGTVQVTFHEIIPNVAFSPGELGRV